MITHTRRAALRLTQRYPDEHYLDDAWSLSDVFASAFGGAIEVGYWEFEGDQRIPPQPEQFEEIFIVLDGGGVFSCDNEIVRLEPGDVLHVKGPTGQQRMWSAGLKTVYIQGASGNGSGER